MMNFKIFYLALILLHSNVTLSKVTSLILGKVDNCVALDSKQVKCWGQNTNRLIAFAVKTPLEEPTLVKQLAGLRNIKFSEYYGCGLSGAGEIKCWGDLAFRSYESGIGSYKEPTHFPTTSAVKDFALGYWHMCVVLVDGKTMCKGQSRNYELGFVEPPKFSKSDEWVEVKLGSFMAKSVDAGSRHTCVLDANGDVYCWGRNKKNAVSPDMSLSILPVKINLEEPAIQVALGEDHSCALLKSGSVKCWGENAELGTTKLPQVIKGLKLEGKYLATSDDHACVIMKNNDVYCWGRNAFGEAGADPEMKRVLVPEKINIANSERLTLENSLSCSHLKNGEIYCWGIGFSVLGTETRNYKPYLFHSEKF